MAKKKVVKVEETADKAKVNRKGVSVHLYMKGDLHESLVNYLEAKAKEAGGEELGPTKTGAIEFMVKKFLQEAGFFPPKR